MNSLLSSRSSLRTLRLQQLLPLKTPTVSRNIITSTSHPPPILSPPFTESPATLIYSESRFVSSSWKNDISSFFPSRGLSVVTIDTTCPHADDDSNDDDWLSRCEQTMVDDIGDTTPGIILMTRGGVPSLIAQFYLESRSLAGLIMIDPVISMDDVRGSSRRYSERVMMSCVKKCNSF